MTRTRENNSSCVTGRNFEGDFGFYGVAYDKKLSHVWYLTAREEREIFDAHASGKEIKFLEKNDFRPTAEDPDPPTPEQLAESKRAERDAKLAATDKYMRPDFPISDAERELVIEYSKWLRDLPTLPEFPDVEIPTVEEWLKQNKKG